MSHLRLIQGGAQGHEQPIAVVLRPARVRGGWQWRASLEVGSKRMLVSPPMSVPEQALQWLMNAADATCCG